MAGERQERRGSQQTDQNCARDPTTRNRTTTLTEIADRFVNKFLKVPSKAALSVRIVCGPKKQFQATAASLEKEDVEHKYGREVTKQLYRRQRSEQKRLAEAEQNLIVDKRRLVDSRPPQPVRMRTTSEETSSCSSTKSHKTKMSYEPSLWSLGSSNSI